MPKTFIFREKDDERYFCLCSGIYANFSFNVKKVRILYLEHFEIYSSFSYCTHSSVYQWSGH